MKYLQQLIYYLYWILFFVLSKVVFLIYEHAKTAGLSAKEILKVFLYGLKMDASFAGYLCILPFVLFIVNGFKIHFNFRKLISIYTIVIATILCLLTVIDLEAYRSWGFRLDATPLQYLNSPKEMAASVSSSPVLLLLLIFIVLVFLFVWVYRSFFRKYIYPSYKTDLLYVLFSVACLVFLFIPIRGGLQQIPLNASNVYFSEKPFANHAAINVPWNIMHSVLNNDAAKKNPYEYLSNAVARQYIDSLYSNADSSASILNTKRPNIIIIILESYTAKFVGCLGGTPGVTPNIDSIARDGMLFSGIYASGDRSEKGLAAILSGYPTQSTTSIIKIPAKTESLPSLAKSLKQYNYHTTYYYGGEPEFANMKSYLLNSGYERLVTKNDFPREDYNSKWGVHDHILLNRFSEDLKKSKQPFFSTLFTLSSHEPYDVPVAPAFEGSDETTKFKNAVHYTDQCIGDFIRQARQQAWWSNTLIILVADHGHRLPGDDAEDAPSKFRIPLIMTGGALAQKNTINKTIGSQTDIATTLLLQLQIPSQDYKWGKDLLSKVARQFAFYIFNDGFGFVTPLGIVTFDNVSKKIIYRDKTVPDEQVNYGKAYLQLSFDDFLKR